MGYDYSKSLKDFNEFSKRILIEEKDISSTADYNVKKPNAVLQNIHYEYLPEKEKEAKMIINLGLFSKSDIMGYVFVFDYNDEASLREMLELYTRINNDEESKGIADELRPTKSFVCNKHPIQINYKGISDYPQVVQKLIDKDEHTKEIVAKIAKIISPRKKTQNQKIEKDPFYYAKRSTFFTNARVNFVVRKAMGIILGQIQQKDGLWKGKAFSKEEPVDEGIKDDGNGLFGGFGLMAMCGGRDRVEKEDEEIERDDDEDDLDRQDSSDDEIDQVEKLPHEDEEEKPKIENKEEDGTNKNCVIY